MKAGYYLRWARKSFEILDKFHGRMFDLGGEESDLWSDDLNCRHHDLERALDDDNYDRLGYDRQGYSYSYNGKMNQSKAVMIGSNIILMRSRILKTRSREPRRKKRISKPRGKR